MAVGNSPVGTGSDVNSETRTPAQRIGELNKIDQSLSTLLASASEAVGVLANKQDSVQATTKYDAQEEKFQKASQTYFATLSSIEVGLRRQVYALEEAGLIQPGEDRDGKKARATEARFDGVSGGGLLDSSWLNARADNSVDERMEREILEEAKRFLSTEKAKGSPIRSD